MPQQEFLDCLTPEDCERLRARLTETEVRKDETVVSEKGASLDVFFVLEGSARAVGLSEEGKQVTYREMATGAIFGELSAIDDLPRSADVVAVEPLTVGRLSQTAFREAIDSDRDFRWAFLSYLAGQMRGMTERIFEFSTMVVRHRVIGELLRMAEATGEPGPRIEMRNAPTHQELGQRISSHREAVSRIISELKKKGILDGSGRRLVILDLDALLEEREDKSGEV